MRVQLIVIGVRLAVCKVHLIVVGVKWLFLMAQLSEASIRLAVYKGSVNSDWSSAGCF
jgi:hypothetical protein